MPKTLFIDSTPDIDKVWKRVHGAKDIPVTVNMGPVDEKDTILYPTDDGSPGTF